MKKITFMMALILIGTMSFAQRAPRAERGEERPNKERSHERMADHLDLTDEQQQQMKDLRLAHLKKTSETQSQMKIKKAELVKPHFLLMLLVNLFAEIRTFC